MEILETICRTLTSWQTLSCMCVLVLPTSRCFKKHFLKQYNIFWSIFTQVCLPALPPAHSVPTILHHPKSVESSYPKPVKTSAHFDLKTEDQKQLCSCFSSLPEFFFLFNPYASEWPLWRSRCIINRIMFSLMFFQRLLALRGCSTASVTP